MFPLLSSKEINGTIVTIFKRSKIRPFTEHSKTERNTLSLPWNTACCSASLAALQKAGKTATSCGTLRPHHKGQLHRENAVYVTLQQPGPAQVVKPFWILGKAFPHARGVLRPSPLAMAELRTDVCHSPPSCTPRDKQVYGGNAPATLLFQNSISQGIPKQSCFYFKLDWRFPNGNDFYGETHARLQCRPSLGSWKSGASFAGAERRASFVSHGTSHWQSYICHLLLFCGLLMNEPLPTLSGICFHRTVMCVSAEATQGG